MSKRFLSLYLIFAIMLCILPGVMMIKVPDHISVGNDAEIQLPVIVIDPGHGGEDCGAIGVNGCFEKNLNLEISVCLYELFAASGYSAVITRTEDKLLYTEAQNIPGKKKVYDLYNRVKISNNIENAVFISIHMNDYSDSSISGLQVWYKEGCYVSRNLASEIKKQTGTLIEGIKSRKIMSADESIYVLANSIHPAVLVECGFLSNPDECSSLCNKEYQKQLCLAIFYAIIKDIDNIKGSVDQV